MYVKKNKALLLIRFKFNILKGGGSKFYGENSFLWFVFAGIPYILLAWLPFFIYGFFNFHKKLNKWSLENIESTIIFLWFLFVLSLSAHKEDRFFFLIHKTILVKNYILFRFLLPLFPFIIIFTTIGLYDSWERVFLNQTSFIFNKKLIKFILFLSIASNGVFFLFAGFVHKSGSIRLFDHLRSNLDEISSIVFFNECHQTPYYAFLHKYIIQIIMLYFFF